MNGVALLVALAVVGADGPQVDYGWRTTEEGQVEYAIQVPAVFIKLIADGEQIHSPVPAEAGRVQRLCIRIGNTPVPHTAASVTRFRELIAPASGQATIVWPAQGLPQATTAVTSGWQPDAEGKLAYYLQIDPTLLSSLKDGDEVHATIDPAAGSMATFIVLAGKQPLPRVAAAPAAPPQVTPLGSAAASSATQPPTAPPLTSLPPSSSPPRRGTGDRFANDARSGAPPLSGIGATAGAGTQYGPPPATSVNLPAAGAQQRDPLSRESAAPQLAYGDAPAASPPPLYPSFDDPRTSDPRTSDPRGYQAGPVAGGFGAPPPGTGYNQFDAGFDAHRPQPAPQPTTPLGGYAAPPSAVDPTRQPQFQSQYAAPPQEPRVASLPPQSVSLAPTPPASFPAPAAATEPADSGSNAGLTWLLLIFSLFLSIGVNLYLGWTTAEYYNRYRLAIDRLRTASRGT